MADKLPPQAPELEEAVLGAIMLESEAITLVEDILAPEDFYVPAHGLIYRAALNLSRHNHPVDLLTVFEELKRMQKADEAGGAFYISRLTSQVASTSHLEYHALIVKEKAHARRLIQLAARLQEELFEPGADINGIQEVFEQQFTQLITAESHIQTIDIGDALHDAIKNAAHIEELRKSGQPVAIPTGIAALDKALDGGWRPTDLAILGARPSTGKTQFALWFARVAAEYGKKSLIVSVEMTHIQLAGRYILEDSRIDTSHFRSGEMDAEEWKAVEEIAGQLWHLPIKIASEHSIRYLANIRAQARKMKRQGGLDLLLVDYVGLIKTNRQHEKRYLELGDISSELKNLAKELNIPVILLSQLNRPPQGQNGKRPQMSDLRESGNLEQDADIVIFLHKPDIHQPGILDENGIPWKNRGELILCKQREGASGITIIYEHDERYKNIW